MVTNKMMNATYTWGDAVRVVANAPLEYRPSQECSVCGIREIETEKAAIVFSEPIGTYLCLVEFSDGMSIEIPERFLTIIKKVSTELPIR